MTRVFFSLCMNRMNLTAVPDFVSRLGNSLHRLYLKHHPITDIETGTLRNISKLEHLDLSYTQLNTLPSEISILSRRLSLLDLSYTPITNINADEF